MKTRRLLLFCLLTLVFRVTGSGHSQANPDPFVEAARKRAAATKVVDVTFKMKEISPRGSPVPGAGWALNGAKAGATLKADLVLESTNRMIFQGSMVRFETNHPVWHAASGKALPTDVLSVSKEGSAKTFYPKGRGRDTWPSGIFGPDSTNMQLKMVYLFPLLAAYRGTNRSLAAYTASSFKASGATQLIGGKDCREYAQQTGKDGRLSYFVDPQLGYNVVRRVLVNQRRTINQIDVNYEKNEICEWIPVAWVEHSYTMSGSLEYRREVEVLRTKFNESLSDDQFDVLFPPGTVVTDQRDPENYKRYRVQADGRLRLLAPGGEELSTVISLGNSPWYRRYLWWYVGGGAASILLVMVLYRRKRRVTPG